MLSSSVHFLVILLVFPGSDIIHPLLIIQVPADGLFNAFLKLEAGFPAQFLLQFGRVNGIAHVVPLTVGHKSNQIEGSSFGIAQQSVNRLYNDFDNVDVLPFVTATDIVGIRNLSLMEYKVDGTYMIFHKEPVAHVLTFAINGEWLTMTDIVDEKRYQFFRKLIRAVVVGAVGHDGRHSIRVMKGTDKMVARCLACRIG